MVLKAYWPLDEDSGSTAKDVRNSNEGTVNGATMGANGILGNNAYDFDGTDDYVSLPDLGLGSSSAFTFSLWVNFDAVSNDQVLFGRYNGTDDILQLWYDNSAGQIKFEAGHTGTTKLEAWVSDAISGSWIHYVCVFEPSGPTATLYQNATEDATDSVTIDDFATGDGPQIGRRNDGYGPFDGRIADVRIYDHALTPQEVQYLYSVGKRGLHVSDRRSL